MGTNLSVTVQVDLLENFVVSEIVFTFLPLKLQPRVHDLSLHTNEDVEATLIM